jgi:aminopeptidase 2
MLNQQEREVLPTHTTFKSYTLELTPNFSSSNFDGRVDIDFVNHQLTKEIVLNVQELKLNSAQIIKNSVYHSLVKNANEIIYQDDLERVILRFDDNIPDEGTLSIEYVGRLNGDMNGFYKSKYVDKNDKEQYMAVTQFEPTSARRAFPCADEPSLKATYQVIMNIPQDKMCLSNTPVLTEELTGNNMKKVTFKKLNRPMSTYLLAFFVGDMEYVENVVEKPVNGGELRLRVYTPRGERKQGEFALEVAEKCMKYYAEYFNMDYPLEKLDMIGIPDFSAGAMENWGLVTYRTKYLLYEEGTSSQKMKSLIALVVAHELAHQWFGNLVTMEWWNDLWLNEGFANYMEYMVADELYPEFNIMEDYISGEYNRALALDQLDSSHPIEADIQKASQVDEIFDAISYAKGSCVIRMLANYLGADKFRDGLRVYLNKYQYKNATTQDLWDVLADVSGKDVSLMMESWTRIQGYPIVSLERRDSNLLLLEQQQYFSTGPRNSNMPVWSLPLNAYNGESINNNTVINEQKCYISNDIQKINCNNVGLYRTMYSKELLKNITELFHNKQISVIDRGCILSDLFNFGYSGYDSVVPALDLAYDAKEKELFVLREMISGFKKVMNVFFKDKHIYDTLRRQLLKVIRATLNQLGYDKRENDSYKIHQTRCLVINTAGMLGQKDVVEEVRKRFLSGKYDPDQRSSFASIYIKSAERNSPEELKYILDKYVYSKSNEEKVDMLRALGCVNTVKEANFILDFVTKEKNVRSQDTYVAYFAMASNVHLGNTVWEYTKNNWAFIKEKFAGNLSMFGTIVSASLSSLSTRDELKNAKLFLDDNKEDISTFQNKVNQSLEKVEQKLEWFDRDLVNIRKWCYRIYSNIAKK